MDTLDLHGIRHSRAEILIEEFILTANLPARIITGNSLTMQTLVRRLVLSHGLACDYENHWNLGALIVVG